MWCREFGRVAYKDLFVGYSVTTTYQLQQMSPLVRYLHVSVVAVREAFALKV